MEKENSSPVDSARALLFTVIPNDCPLLNFYHWGSRWCENLLLSHRFTIRWGTSHAESDWDFLAVVGDNYDQPKIGNVANKDDIDIAVITLTNFNHLLEMHVPWTLPFLRYPSHGIIQQTITFAQNVECMRLRKAMLTNMDVNLRQAKRVWNVDKNYYRAKKRIFAVVQMLVLTTQIAKYDKMTDMAEPNQYYHGIMEQADGDWDAFKAYFNPMVTKLTDEFKTVVNLYAFWEEDYLAKSKLLNASVATKTNNTNSILNTPTPTSVTIVSPDKMVHKTLIRYFLETCTLSQFTRYFSLYHQTHPDCPELVYFHFNIEYAPWNSSIGKECNGLLLRPRKKLSNGGGDETIDKIDPNVIYSDWRVVALPIARIDRWDSSHAPQINWKHVAVSELIDGPSATMYFYGGKWRVVTDQTSDGSEIVHARDNVTFADLFWNLFWSFNVKKLDSCEVRPQGEIMADIDAFLSEFRDFNFNFVLVHPYVKNYVTYEKEDIYLTRVLHLDPNDGDRNQELDYVDFGKKCDWKYLAREAKKNTSSKLFMNTLKNGKTAGYSIVDESNQRVVVMSDLYEKLKFASQITEFDVPLLEKNLVQIIAQYYNDPIIQNLSEERNKDIWPHFSRVKEKLDMLAAEVDACVVQLAHVEELEDFVEQAKQFGAVANWMYYVKRFNHPNFIAFISANKGSRRKLTKALEHWWDNNYKTTVERVSYAFK